MPGNEQGVIPNNIQNKQHGTSIYPAIEYPTTKYPAIEYPGSEMNNGKTGTTNSGIYNKAHGSSNDYNASNSQDKTINLHIDENNSNNSYQPYDSIILIIILNSNNNSNNNIY
ncbi:hypothetical protein PFLG_00135 [Plasmodium falciparum RAJ116]|uniref:Uncharacterized protein n=1 Tax=Plasmodium falciparum RAJ116 TaxID=580058 RepID=A0A0L0CSI9_PLAFA|nr:hypothetical protein PFLG_00135 [Plasmodium falciparum RAJ116]